MEHINRKQWKDFSEGECWKALQETSRIRISALINQLANKDSPRDDDQYLKGQIAEIGALMRLPAVQIEVLENQSKETDNAGRS